MSAVAETTTWQFQWNTSKANGGEGFYNFGSSRLDQDTISATLNQKMWYVASKETNTYSYTSTAGQYIGSATSPATYASVFSYDFDGLVTEVTVTALRQKEKSDSATLQVSIGGTAYLLDGTDTQTAALGTDAAAFKFVPAAEPKAGKIDIVLQQPGEKKAALYLKELSITSQAVESSVTAPTFSLAAGSYDTPQQLELTVAGADAGSYTIYYTTDGSSPKLADGTRRAYTEAINIANSCTVKAVTLQGDAYSQMVSADYVIRQDPKLAFNHDSVSVEAPDNYAGLYLTNPSNVKPITYTSSNESVCVVDKYGDLWSVKPGECTISALFAGDANYLPDTAFCHVTITAKKPLNKPVVSPMGGTFDGPVEVSISVDDDRAYTIWYSTTAADSAALTDDPVIIPSKSGTITISESCHLLVLAAGYSVFSPLVEADFEINQQEEDLALEIGFPGYSTPFVRSFVPAQVPVNFTAQTDGEPSSWLWEFKLADTETVLISSSEQNPVVTFNEVGYYDVKLTASDSNGSYSTEFWGGIKVGGSEQSWNISDEESVMMDQILLGWYGNYAGTNWLGIDAFAEKYQPALSESVSIDSVAIYFASITAVSKNAEIKVSVRDADVNGNPGEVLATGTLRASQLIFNDQWYEPTFFVLDQTAHPSGAFFVSVEGFPNEANEKGVDDIAILCVRRETAGSLNTAWQWVADEDGQGGYLSTGKWYENSDDPLSMAIAPIVNYGVPSAIETTKATLGSAAFKKVMIGNQLLITNGETNYMIGGKKVER